MYVSRVTRLQVSPDVLSSVPWAGTSRLVCIMDQVAKRGPNDQKTWSKLVRRADLILDSFNTNNLSRMAVLLTKNSFSDSAFLQKLKLQCLRRLDDSDLLSCCGFLYALNKMGLCDEKVVLQFRQRVSEQLDTAKDSYPLVLILNVYCNCKDLEMVNRLLMELKIHMNSLKPQSFAMIIIDVLSNFDDKEALANLDPFIINSLNYVQSMDLRSLVRLYSVFSSTNHPLREQYLVNLAATLNESIQHATLHQLCIVLRGYTKSRTDTALLRGVLDAIKSKCESGELQELIFLLSNILKLNLKGLTLVDDLVNQIVKFRNINSVQLSNVVYLSGKHKVNIPGRFIYENYSRLKGSFTLRDLALFTYGMDKLGDLSLHSELNEHAKEMMTNSGPTNKETSPSELSSNQALNNDSVEQTANGQLDTQSHIILKNIFKNLN